jgi:hypothetical protein
MSGAGPPRLTSQAKPPGGRTGPNRTHTPAGGTGLKQPENPVGRGRAQGEVGGQ